MIAYEIIKKSRIKNAVRIMRDRGLQVKIGRIIVSCEDEDDYHPNCCIKYENVKKIGNKFCDPRGGIIDFARGSLPANMSFEELLDD